ncbi:MAG: YchJ family metal-binding protein [Burkholderiaceae bacterium]|jgi:SEC-C motif-containing protein
MPAAKHPDHADGEAPNRLAHRTVQGLGTSRITTACPCGGERYTECCGRFLDAGATPENAVQLMRARYCAYVLSRFEFLMSTWHPDTRPRHLPDPQMRQARWLGLEIRDTESGEESATVQFVARYRLAGRGHRLHEKSRFTRIAGRWFYHDGEFLE